MNAHNVLLPCLVASLSLVACSDDRGTPTDVETPPLASELTAAAVLAQPAGTAHYIIKLARTADAAAARASLMSAPGGFFDHAFAHVLDGRGFVAWLTPERAREIADDPSVEYVEEDSPAMLTSTREASGAWDWGLDRIDQRQGQGSLDGAYTYYGDGTGVHVYIVDTGIDSTLSQFSGRLGAGSWPAFYVDTAGYHYCPNPYEDLGQHGTLSASVAVGATYGVATDATIHSVRVTCGASPFASRIVDGFDWIMTNGSTPGVINMSLASTATSVRDAINDAYDAGWLVTASAGNEATNASSWASNTAYGALVVAASNKGDSLAGFSNYGSTVDLVAPGVVLLVALPGGDTAAASGTSLSAPLVAGVAALLLEENSSLSPAELAEILTGSATTNELHSGTLNGTPNRLLYSIHLWMNDIFGPDIIEEEDYYTYAMVDPIGGSGSYSYQWSYSTGGSFSTVSTSQSYERFIEDGDPDFTLRATLSSGGATFVRTIDVQLCWNHASIPCNA